MILCYQNEKFNIRLFLQDDRLCTDSTVVCAAHARLNSPLAAVFVLRLRLSLISKYD